MSNVASLPTHAPPSAAALIQVVPVWRVVQENFKGLCVGLVGSETARHGSTYGENVVWHEGDIGLLAAIHRSDVQRNDLLLTVG